MQLLEAAELGDVVLHAGVAEADALVEVEGAQVWEGCGEGCEVAVGEGPAVADPEALQGRDGGQRRQGGEVAAAEVELREGEPLEGLEGSLGDSAAPEEVEAAERRRFSSSSSSSSSLQCSVEALVRELLAVPQAEGRERPEPPQGPVEVSVSAAGREPQGLEARQQRGLVEETSAACRGRSRRGRAP